MIEVRVLDDSFTIRDGKKIILAHDPERPCIALGMGELDAASNSGTFRIRKRSISELLLVRISRAKHFTDGSCEIVLDDTLKLQITPETDGSANISFTLLKGSWNVFRMVLPGQRDEHIFGCGEQFTQLDLKGRRVPIWISEPGVGRNWSLFSILTMLKTRHIPRRHQTYFSMPAWVSTSGYYASLNSASYCELDFRKSSSAEIALWDIPKSITIGMKDTMKEASGALSLLHGRQKKLPDWVYDGMLLGVQGGRDTVQSALQKVQRAGMKVAALWCQDWQGIRMTSFGKQLFWAWKWDNELYPDLPGFIQELRKKGVRFLGYNNTFLIPRGKMYQEAKAAGYLVQDSKGQECRVYVPSDPASMVDFTNPRAVKWMKQIIRKNMIDIGMSGWMADFGEYIPHDARMHNGEPGLKYHNRYPVDWARINSEAVEEAGKSDEIVFFMRAGFTGSTRWSPCFWNGDQLVDWSREDGLPSALTASLSLSICGAAMVHSDIGGYTTAGWKKRSAELLMRWAEYAAFTPLMRSHEGNRPQRNVQPYCSDEQVLEHLARMTRVFCDLKPYHQALQDQYCETGVSPMRIPLMEYPGDEELLRYPYQYMYGSDLLAAPVLKPGKRTWEVRLPDDRWVHLWTGEQYSGPRTVTVGAPLGHIPVFYREQSSWEKLFASLKDA